jgi:hypothetical protein
MHPEGLPTEPRSHSEVRRRAGDEAHLGRIRIPFRPSLRSDQPAPYRFRRGGNAQLVPDEYRSALWIVAVRPSDLVSGSHIIKELIAKLIKPPKATSGNTGVLIDNRWRA